MQISLCSFWCVNVSFFPRKPAPVKQNYRFCAIRVSIALNIILHCTILTTLVTKHISLKKLLHWSCIAHWVWLCAIWCWLHWIYILFFLLNRSHGRQCHVFILASYINYKQKKNPLFRMSLDYQNYHDSSKTTCVKRSYISLNRSCLTNNHISVYQPHLLCLTASI